MSETLRPVFDVQTETAFDVDASSNSASINVADFKLVTVQAVLASGTFATAVLQAQCSANDTDWVDIPVGGTVTGPGMIAEVSVGTEFFRVRVSTLEGSAGTANLWFNAKR